MYMDLSFPTPGREVDGTERRYDGPRHLGELVTRIGLDENLGFDEGT
jgi:hypothetical protein